MRLDKRRKCVFEKKKGLGIGKNEWIRDWREGPE